MTIIRAVSPSERDHWQRLFNAYADFYGTTLSEASKSTVWGWIFDPDNDFWCDLAVDDAGEVTGFTQYQLMHRSLGGSQVCYLSDLYVDPAHRGGGTGRLLIDHVISFARSRHISNVRWLTQEFNYAGRKLYDSYTRKSDFILYSLSVD